MMTIISKILSLLKYWKIGGIVLIVIGFAVSFHIAQSRGERLKTVEETLAQERKTFQTQLKLIEKARQDDKERNNFRKSQAKKIRLAGHDPVYLDDELRDAYERLRERAKNHSSR